MGPPRIQIRVGSWTSGQPARNDPYNRWYSWPILLAVFGHRLQGCRRDGLSSPFGSTIGLVDQNVGQNGPVGDVGTEIDPLKPIDHRFPFGETEGPIRVFHPGVGATNQLEHKRAACARAVESSVSSMFGLGTLNAPVCKEPRREMSRSYEPNTIPGAAEPESAMPAAPSVSPVGTGIRVESTGMVESGTALESVGAGAAAVGDSVVGPTPSLPPQAARNASSPIVLA